MATETQKPKLYLMNPKNADFVRGKAPTPADGGQRSKRIGYAVVAAVAGVTLLLMLLSGVRWQNYWGLMRSGVETSALVVGKAEDDDGVRTYTITHEFEVGGETYRGSTVVSFTTYQDTARGDTLPVVYLPDNPAVSQHVGYVTPPWGLTQLVLFSLLVTLLVLVGALNNRVRQTRFQEAGQLVRGELTEATFVPGDSYRQEDPNSSYSYYMVYRFTEPDTLVSLDGKHVLTLKLKEQRQAPEAGMTVAVYYADRETHRLL
jgi:hypothetical protein